MLTLNGLPVSVTHFAELLVTNRTNIIELRSNTPAVSSIRNVTATSGSGSVTVSASEYVLATTAAASDSATLDSAERGRYQPGYGAEAGIGIRYADTPTGEQDVQFGYFDANNGFFFGRDATGIYVASRRDGTTTKVYQSAWNADTLSATGENPSGLRLNLAAGNIFHVLYSWYGYGPVHFIVMMKDSDGYQREVVAHTISPSQQVSILDPNLPIRAHIENGATEAAHTLYVGGRQFSVIGRYDPVRRVVSERRLSLGSVSTTVLPLIAFRRKSGYDDVSVKIDGFDIITDQNLVVEIRTTPTSLTGASYGTPTNHTAAECAVEADIAATAVSGGVVLWSGLVEAGGPSGNRSGFSTRDALPQDLIGTNPIVICARRAGASDATVSCVFRVSEEW